MHGDLEGRDFVERLELRNHLVEAHCEAVHVGLLGVALRVEHFRGHPGGGADVPGHGGAGVDEARGAVIGDLAVEVGGNEEVERLQVPVDDAHLVEVEHALGSVECPGEYLVKVVGPLLLEDHVMQRAVLNDLRHDEGVLALFDASPQHPHQVGVVQQTHHGDFLIELGHVNTFVELLVGDVHALVDGAVDVGSGALANPLQRLEVLAADLVVDHHLALLRQHHHATHAVRVLRVVALPRPKHPLAHLLLADIRRQLPLVRSHELGQALGSLELQSGLVRVGDECHKPLELLYAVQTPRSQLA
mmetsp:Transcript_14469/g.56895  ORF Transcript_14469/g.56895 Transcript_14469/m.56895 type:complete len:303 (-) Transcript_14469:1353-2261(-)